VLIVNGSGFFSHEMPPAASESKVRPHSSLLKQQRLPAWQPILTPPHVSACFLVTCAIFIPIGVVILQANDDVIDVEFRYDHVGCSSTAPLFNETVNNVTTVMGCRQTVAFEIPLAMQPPIYVYYKLTNFFQNHRRYSGSRLDPQLAGDFASSLTDADPLATVGGKSGTSNTAFVLNGVNRTFGEFVYSPAGLIAWSMFNDSFTLFKYDDANPNSNSNKSLICNGTDFSRFDNLPLGGSISQNQCRKRGIAWRSDVSDKFKTPALGPTVWSAPWSGYGAIPMNTSDAYYTNGWYAGEMGHLVPATTDEDLMVWMRSSSLPDFRKLYRVIDIPLAAGTYRMDIDSFFDVSGFGGTKSFAITTLSWLGGKNPFLGMVYLILGCLSFVAAVIFAVIHQVCGDRTQRAIDELIHDAH
jgi:hypothetical protein